jgi:DNA-binding HxlR family transcriptional regulator
MNKSVEIFQPLAQPAMVVSKPNEQCEGGRHERELAMRDAMDVLRGKWKIQIIGTLIFKGKLRFMDMLREVDGIAAKMLSKELQDLEAHQLVKRTVMNTKPITVEYEITEYGKSLEKVICSIVEWGQTHRKNMLK